MSGWDDDDLDLDDLSNDDNDIALNNNDDDEDGWDDDGDLDLSFEDHDDNNNDNDGGDNKNTRDDDVNDFRAYVNYLRDLDSHCPLQYNLSDGVKALNEYYRSRSNMKAYTLKKEIHRMEYTVITEDARELCGADAIRNEYESSTDVSASIDEREDLIWSASNQSILADVLVAITAENGPIRPQFLATAVAKTVSFRMSFVGGPDQYMSECRAVLAISVPLDTNRLVLADLTCYVKYNVEELHCHIVQIDFKENDLSENDLLVAAKQYNDMFLGDSDISHTRPLNQNVPSLNDQRDVLMLRGVQGLGVALRQLDETAGLSNKLGAVSNFLTKDLNSCLEEYDKELLQEQWYDPNGADDIQIQRPDSLLGNLFGGITKVARSAAQPKHQSVKESPLRLYRKEEDDHETSQFVQEKRRTSIKELTHEKESNGWSDDDIEFEDVTGIEDKVFQKQSSISVEETIRDIPQEDVKVDRSLTRKRWLRPKWTNYGFTDEGIGYVIQ